LQPAFVLAVIYAMAQFCALCHGRTKAPSFSIGMEFRSVAGRKAAAHKIDTQ
jgi:cytochrome c2